MGAMPSTKQILAAGALLLLGMACPACAEAPKALHATLVDYLEMPTTGNFDSGKTRSWIARVNFLVEEPGGKRAFVISEFGGYSLTHRAFSRACRSVNGNHFSHHFIIFPFA